MENEKLPIKFFAPREVDELRIEGNKNPEKPKWVLQGEELKQRADCFVCSLFLFLFFFFFNKLHTIDRYLVCGFGDCFFFVDTFLVCS